MRPPWVLTKTINEYINIQSIEKGNFKEYRSKERHALSELIQVCCSRFLSLQNRDRWNM